MATKHYKVIQTNISLLSKSMPLTWQQDTQQRRKQGLHLSPRKHMRRFYLVSLRFIALIWLDLNFKIKLLSIKRHDKTHMLRWELCTELAKYLQQTGYRKCNNDMGKSLSQFYGQHKLTLLSPKVHEVVHHQAGMFAPQGPQRLQLSPGI